MTYTHAIEGFPAAADTHPLQLQSKLRSCVERAGKSLIEYAASILGQIIGIEREILEMLGKFAALQVRDLFLRIPR